jgi:aminoglycoside 3-N-acetyltransferase
LTVSRTPDQSEQRKITPDELTEGFERLGLKEGDSVVMHASLESVGDVDGGAAMVLHRLLRVLGKGGTLLMPSFTSITRHSSTHDGHTKPGCWCEGREGRHLPFIPELQPDKTLGEIAKRLCSWPASRRSGHPAYSFVAVGKHGDELVRDYSLDDPLLPIKRFLKYTPRVLTVGVGFNLVTAIHVAEQLRLFVKFARERALTFTSRGPAWLDITALGCSNGFQKLGSQPGGSESKGTKIGLATSQIYSMKNLIESADSLLEERPTALLCDNSACLSCSAV